eukprot:TRINITY_DN44662_c0_g1_i1.p1 TRINITY_DN44662_c0_g1~~TRINITY_DN44662_c0_g1_i1.p1  ORF type:complete len:760 (-),score=111.90 TRINITY_DN44662_c0_g1_i1:372-2528(-)
MDAARGRSGHAGMDSEDWRDMQPGIVVRNTFIDVCMMEEDTNSDESSPCRSPQRRNVSEPPSPSRKRNPWGQNEEDAGGSDPEEEDDDPGSIPTYQWAADGGVISAEGLESEPGPPVDWKQPPWLMGPPGSPKKVVAKKPSRRKDASYCSDSFGMAPEFELGRGLTGLRADAHLIGGLGGVTAASGSHTGPCLGLGASLTFGREGLGPGLGFGQGLGGLGLQHSLGLHPADGHMPIGKHGSCGGLAEGLGGLGLESFVSTGMSDTPVAGEADRGATYISENPPPNPALGGVISTEAPAYIVKAACNSGGSPTPALPLHGTQPAVPEAGRRTGRTEAGQRSPPLGHVAVSSASAHDIGGLQPQQLTHGVTPGSRVPHQQSTGDAGDRRVDGAAVDRGFLDYMALSGLPYSPYGVPGRVGPSAWSPMVGVDAQLAPMQPPIPSMPGRGGATAQIAASAATAFASEMQEAQQTVSVTLARQPGQFPAATDSGSRSEKNNDRSLGKSRGKKQQGEASSRSQNDRGTPWVAPGAIPAATAAGTQPTGEKGGTKATNTEDAGKGGEAKGHGGKVQLSGGGPKRTDYIKKYGASEGETVGVTPIGPQPITTMMLKNIPCRKSQEEVMTQVNSRGFSERYDFFYLPRDVKFRANLGYAFINFLTPEDASKFEAEMNGYRFIGSGSSKACAVVPAHVQGLTNNLSAFKRTEVMRSSRRPYFSGVITL